MLILLDRSVEANAAGVLARSSCKTKRRWSLILISLLTFLMGVRQCACIAFVRGRRRWHVIFIFDHGLHRATPSVRRAFLLGRSLDEPLAIVLVEWRRLVLAIVAATAASQRRNLIGGILVLILNMCRRRFLGLFNPRRLLMLQQLLLQIFYVLLLILDLL